MERQVFDRMAELDSTHWWYLGRRQVLADVIRREINPPTGARILEIGCGTGHNFAMLGAFGTVDGIELDAEARAIASQRLGRPVLDAALPELSGVEDGTYDLIALLDVLEHVAGDEAALRAITAKLKPGGRILIAVPANEWMWSAHDVIHHHHRRYNRATLSNVIKRAGLTPVMTSHFNTLLFPAAAAVRLLGKIADKQEADDAQPAPMLNRAFSAIFGFERHLVGRVPLPFGVSLLTVLKPAS
jgi:SAM-dependent methyltransferase